MALQTSSNLSNSISTRYTSRYQRAARVRRLYDQLAVGVDAALFDLETRRGMGSTYTFNFASDMNPGHTAISEIADIVPQILRDAVATITPTSLGEALKWTQLVNLEAYTDYIADRAEKVGDNAMESIENLAIATALQGSLVAPGTARASLDAGTTTDNWNEVNMWKAATLAQSLKMPSYVDSVGRSMKIAIAHSDAFYDLFHAGNVVSAAIYGGLPGRVLLNGELGELAGFKLIISPFAKVFASAGAANGTAAGYTLSANASALDKTMGVTTGTNVGYGRMLLVGTKETANTFYDTNERVRWVSGTTTTTLVGSGANGGVRFDHASGETVSNSDSVYPVVYGVPGSLVKVFAREVGAFGEMVGPLEDGIAHQFQSLAWKFFGNYGRIGENRVIRGEYSSSLDA